MNNKNNEKMVYYDTKGKFRYVHEYDEDNNVIKTIYYHTGEKTIACIEEFAPYGNLYKITNYNKDFKMFDNIQFFDSDNELLVTVYFNKD